MSTRTLAIDGTHAGRRRIAIHMFVATHRRQGMKTRAWIAAAGLLAATGAAQAALVDLGNGTVRDTTTDLVWLQDWNLNGPKTWATQRDWATQLDFAGSTGWALPTMAEFFALHAAYGNLGQLTQFRNIPSGGDYWSRDPLNAIITYTFLADGRGNYHYVGDQLPAVAVRLGNVGPVPEAQTCALMLSGLGLIGFVARRRTRQSA